MQITKFLVFFFAIVRALLTSSTDAACCCRCNAAVSATFEPKLTLSYV